MHSLALDCLHPSTKMVQRVQPVRKILGATQAEGLRVARSITKNHSID